VAGGIEDVHLVACAKTAGRHVVRSLSNPWDDGRQPDAFGVVRELQVQARVGCGIAGKGQTVGAGEAAFAVRIAEQEIDFAALLEGKAQVGAGNAVAGLRLVERGLVQLAVLVAGYLADLLRAAGDKAHRRSGYRIGSVDKGSEKQVSTAQ
jgi:hypothetical protein